MHGSDGNRKHRILIYSDEGVLATGAAGLLSSLETFEITVAEPDLSGVIPLVQRISPDFILLGLTTGMTVGFLTALRKAAPRTHLILWSRHFSAELLDNTRDLGKISFLRQGSSTGAFLDDFTKIAAGAPPVDRIDPAGSTRISLTQREAQLVNLLVQGLRNKEIAACLGITEGTVRIYLTKLFLKTGARDRFELAVFGMKNMTCGHAFWDGHNAFVTEADAERARPVLRSLLLLEPKRKKGYDQPEPVARAAKASA